MIALTELSSRLTITVPEAGELLGLGRGQSYAAAQAGQIPTLRLGRRLLVPVPKLLELVGLPPPDMSEPGPATGPGAATVHALTKSNEQDQHAPDPAA